jgi:1,2-diacylglycerol 3-alpha-glucosyltransferase
MKKILIFSLAYYPSHISGAEVAIKEITDRISPSDIEFHMVTLSFDPSAQREEKIGNVHVHRIGFGGVYVSKILFIPLAALKARTLHARLKFDGMWAMMTYMLFPLVLARFLGLMVPYVITLQDGDPYSKVFGRWFIKPALPILDYGFRHATVVQAISEYLAEWAPKRGYPGRVVVIPNGASIESAQEYPKAELDELRSKLNVSDGQIILLTVARLVHQKAQDMVIRALPLLPAHVRYVLVGEGDDRPMLKALAEELRVRDRVTFVGHVDRTMTAKYRKISNIFISPSRSEGQGISFLSTMVSGLPLVATQVGGIAEFLFDAKRNPDMTTTGWAVDVDSPEQIAAAVAEILSHPDAVARVTQNARLLMHEKYSWDSVVKQMREKVFSL